MGDERWRIRRADVSATPKLEGLGDALQAGSIRTHLLDPTCPLGLTRIHSPTYFPTDLLLLYDFYEGRAENGKTVFGVGWFSMAMISWESPEAELRLDMRRCLGSMRGDGTRMMKKLAKSRNVNADLLTIMALDAVPK